VDYAFPRLGVGLQYLLQSRIAVDELIEVHVRNELGVVVKRNELPFLLKETIKLRGVLPQDVVGQVDRTLYVTVVRTRHCTVHGFVGTCYQALITLDVLGDVGRAMLQGLLVEDSETLVDGFALVKDVTVDLLPLAK
jgi:hypothetical protein